MTEATLPPLPEQECVQCGRWFRPHRVGKEQKPRKRATCSRRCANLVRSWALHMAHRQAQLKPEAYKAWVGRDYSSMGKARHAGGAR